MKLKSLLLIVGALLGGAAMAPAQLMTVQHTFTDTPDGSQPRSSLVLWEGKFYGTTYGGGANGEGSVFRINADGTGYETLYSFRYNLDGGNPESGRVAIKTGRIYGTTSAG